MNSKPSFRGRANGSGSKWPADDKLREEPGIDKPSAGIMDSGLTASRQSGMTTEIPPRQRRRIGRDAPQVRRDAVGEAAVYREIILRHAACGETLLELLADFFT